MFEVFIILIISLGAIWYLYDALKNPQKNINNNPYKIYTAKFDQMNYAADVPNLLSDISLDYKKGYLEKNPSIWPQNIKRANEIYSELTEKQSDSFDAFDSTDIAITFLIDHSGSLKGQPIAHIAAAIRKISYSLHEQNIVHEVLGFSTAGWHGGYARQEWMRKGRPKIPGRLCALHHIIYRDFETELDQKSWETMLHPDILRENVDGEALIWASERLNARKETNKILIVISDGAPVDDSTLLKNGHNYMANHYSKVKAEISEHKEIILAGIGLEYDDSKDFDHYQYVSDETKIMSAIVSLLNLILK